MFDGASTITTNLMEECNDYRNRMNKENIDATDDAEFHQDMEKTCKSYENLHKAATQNLEKFKSLKQRITEHGIGKTKSNE